MGVSKMNLILFSVVYGLFWAVALYGFFATAF